MKRLIFILFWAIVVMLSCRKNDGETKVEIPKFNFPQTITFQPKLSSYHIFKGIPSNLIPAEEFQLLELSSTLFTDYAHKQRLMKVPLGGLIEKRSDGSLDYPDGTILTKTFFYFKDERDTSLGKRIVETRLEIKEDGKWNIATYQWNDSQTDATLKLFGHDTPVSWINSKGNELSTLYHLPSQNECMTCHQASSKISPIGPTLLNINKTVNRDSQEVNQISHLQSLGILQQFSIKEIPDMVDYTDDDQPLHDRGRAYLAMNCSHCHNANAWNIPAEKGFDFRYETPFEYTGIQNGKERISRNVLNGEMPFIGTTMKDQEGIALVVEYLNAL